MCTSGNAEAGTFFPQIRLTRTVIPPAFQKDVDALPAVVRALLEQELEAGNEIDSVSHTFPAPPVGAAIMMARPISTRPRASGDGIVFRDHNSSLYAGWFTDERGYFYLLEPPRPAPPVPDMNEIRRKANEPREEKPTTSGSSVVDEFRASMHVDYEKWHDGIGFDLAVIERASDEERAQIVQLLLPINGWREVEALAAIDSEKARAALTKALKSGSAEVRTAVTSYAPWIGSKSERTATLVHSLRHAEIYGGLSSALDQVEDFHPPEIVDELFRGLFVRPGEIATNFAGMLAFIYKKGDSAFDWNHRPLFLKFNSDDGAERRAAFSELCALLELDEGDVLKRIGPV